jgi:hypothetical protein
MNKKELDSLINIIVRQFREKIQIVSGPFAQEAHHGIVLPFYLDSQTGLILGFYPTVHDDTLTISDELSTLGEIESLGVVLNETTLAHVKKIAEQFGCSLDQETLCITRVARRRDLFNAIRDLIQVGFKINFTLSARAYQAALAPTFVKRATQILRRNKLKYVSGERASIPGRRVLTHRFDLIVLNGAKRAVRYLDDRAPKNLQMRIEAFAFTADDLKGLDLTELVGIYNSQNRYLDTSLKKLIEDCAQDFADINDKTDLERALTTCQLPLSGK